MKTRAGLIALAVLVGLSFLGHRSAHAQSGPGVPPYGSPNFGFSPEGYDPGSPYQTPLPPEADPCNIYPNYVDTGSRQVGPLVRADGFFMRVEYLNWNIQKPGRELLGAPVAGVADPSRPFVVFDPGTAAPLAFAQVPTTSSMNLGNISGLQVTGGVSFIDGGSVEVSAFMLARKSSGFRLGPGGIIPFDTDGDQSGPAPDPPAVEIAEGEALPLMWATSTLNHGQVSDHVLLYDTFQAVFQSQLWGAEANYFYDLDAVGFLQFRPLIGVRYINLTERLTQTGVFLSDPPVITTIDAHTTNNLAGPQIGFRTSVVTEYLEVGITPKIFVLASSMTTNVFTNHLRANFDPVVASSDHTTQASFGADVGAYVSLNITPRFAIRGGYNLLWLGRVTRPQKDVYYNDNGIASPPDVVARLITTDVLITGFSVGGELRF
jgi:hypothetical protein